LLEACGLVRAFVVNHPDRWQLVPHPEVVRGAEIATACACGQPPLAVEGAAPDATDASVVRGTARGQLVSAWLTELRDVSSRAARAELLCGQLEELHVARADMNLRTEGRGALSPQQSAAVARFQSPDALCSGGHIHVATLPSTAELNELEAYLRAYDGNPAVPVADYQSALNEIQPQARRRAQRSLPGPAMGAIFGEEAAGHVEGMLRTVLEGLARFLVERAEAEIQTFVVDRLRQDLCVVPAAEPATPTPTAPQGGTAPQTAPQSGTAPQTAPQGGTAPQTAPQGGTAPQTAPRRDAEVQAALHRPSAILLENTCSFLGDGTFTFSAEFGASFEAAVMSDLLAAPRSILTLIEARMTPEETANLTPEAKAAMRTARVLLELALTLLEAPDPADVLHALADVVATWGVEGTQLARVMQAAALICETASRTQDGASFEDEQLVAVVDLAVGGLTPEQRRIATRLARHLREWMRNIRTPRPRAQPVTRPPNGEDDEEIDPDGSVAGGANAAGAAPPADRTIDVPLVLSNGVSVVDDLLAFAGATLPQRIPRWFVTAMRQLLSGQPAEMLSGALTFVREGLAAVSVPVPDGVVRVLSLGTELATAGDAEEAARAIDHFAAPVGSWRVKEQQDVTVALTGFLGVWGGAEYAFASSRTTDSGGGAFGILGLVGVDVTWAINRSWSFGFFVNLLDVGAFVTASASDPEATEQDESGLEISPLQFVAPGAFLRFGLPDVPIVLGAGLTMLPWGRNVVWEDDSGDAQSELVPVLRAQVFAAVDVTIWPF
jgi:hypothetical protein